MLSDDLSSKAALNPHSASAKYVSLLKRNSCHSVVIEVFITQLGNDFCVMKESKLENNLSKNKTCYTFIFSADTFLFLKV